MARIIDDLADLITNIGRSFKIPKYNVVIKGEKLVAAGLLNDALLQQINKNKNEIGELRDEITSYKSAAKKSSNVIKNAKEKIEKARQKMESLRKDFSKDHPFLGKYFLLTSIPAAIPLIGDVVKRGLCRVVSPEYRECLEDIADQNDIITEARIDEQRCLEQINEARANIEEKKVENKSIYDVINELYKQNEDIIPVILYTQDNISTFQQAHEQGIISDRFMNTITDYLNRMKTGQDLPGNINESEFLDVLKDYKAIIDSFKRNGDKSMLKDPEFLSEMDENIVAKRNGRDQLKNNFIPTCWECGINPRAFKEMVEKSSLSSKLELNEEQVLTMIGVMTKMKTSSIEEIRATTEDLIKSRGFQRCFKQH